MTETEERQRFVEAALSYRGTAYHHHGQVKGAGVDCGTLILCAAKDVGLVPQDYELTYYSPQWHLHRSREEYMARVLDYCHEVAFPALPGDIAIFKFGRVFSHGSIVIDWPRIVHACQGRPVSEDDAVRAKWLAYVGERGEAFGKPRPVRLVSFWKR